MTWILLPNSSHINGGVHLSLILISIAVNLHTEEGAKSLIQGHVVCLTGPYQWGSSLLTTFHSLGPEKQHY